VSVLTEEEEECEAKSAENVCDLDVRQQRGHQLAEVTEHDGIEIHHEEVLEETLRRIVKADEEIQGGHEQDSADEEVGKLHHRQRRRIDPWRKGIAGTLAVEYFAQSEDDRQRIGRLEHAHETSGHVNDADLADHAGLVIIVDLQVHQSKEHAEESHQEKLGTVVRCVAPVNQEETLQHLIELSQVGCRINGRQLRLCFVAASCLMRDRQSIPFNFILLAQLRCAIHFLVRRNLLASRLNKPKG
jgi:hypothetical protein